MRIVICGGHLTPALALLERLEVKKDFEIYFFGRKYATEESLNFSAEYKVLAKKPLKFTSITTGRLQRKFTRHTILSLLKIPIGFIQSFFYLAKIRPNLIISFGGYLSPPVVFAGWLLGIDSITHEQASIAGLATKINSLFTKKVFLTWHQSQKYFDKGGTEIIGNLTRQSIFKKTAKNPKIQEFLNRAGKLILATGGNLGSHFLNKRIFALVPELKNYLIFHQVGTTNFEGDLDRAKKIKQANYFAVDYLDSDDIGAVLNRADLVISRSGANTVWDLAVLGKVAVFIPLPISAGGEQLANSKILEAVGSARVLSQDKVNESSLTSTIDKVFKNHKAFEARAKAFAKTLPIDAAEKVAKYIKC